MPVEIRLLGEFDVLTGGSPSTSITSRKARALLAYLCLKAARPQQRENLAKLLWGEVSQDEHARKSLRQALSVLRRDLPEQLIVASRDELSLNPTLATIDVLEFEKLAGASTRDELERGVELYRGDLLEGFQSRADAFDDWLLGERTRLRQLAIDALGCLLERQQQEHDYAGATKAAIRMVSLDPLRESAHRRLMRLYAEQGRLGDALDQYENCRQVLKRELGREPESSTSDLLQHLRQNRHRAASTPRVLEQTTELRVVAVLAATRHEETTGPAAGDHIREALEEQGGLLLRRTHNAVLGVFGTMRSQGSEAARAVCAAERAASVARCHGYGVSLAQAMVSRLDDTVQVVGEAVSNAAHLASVAAPATVAVSESVRQALRDSSLTRGMQLSALRDGAGGVHAWQIGTSRDSQSSAQAKCFVGRTRELDVLRAILSACGRMRAGQLVSIRGEAGIGKTRLLEQLLTLATREGFRIQRAAALDFGQRSERDVIAQLTRGLLHPSTQANTRESVGTDGSEPTSSRDQSLLLELAAMEGDAPREAAEQSVREARAERQRELWLDLWQRELDRGPTLVAIEDLHWVPPVAFDHLALLLGLTHASPLLVVVTTRPETPVEHPGWLGAQRGAAGVTLDLGPLSTAEGRQLADELAVRDPEHVEAAIQRSGGHPLFLEQILKARRPVHLSPSIHVVVQTRLDQLEPGEVAALRGAAVLGQQFRIGMLSELLESDVPTEGLLKSGLIQSERARFRFAHALIRDAVYETLPPVTRRALHSRAARIVRSHDRALTAEHLALASDPGAAEAYLEAAEEADRHDRVPDALKLTERGLTLASDGTLAFTLMLLKARLLGRLGQREAAEQCSRDTLAMATTENQTMRAWLSLAECLRGTPRDAEALSALQAAERAASPDDHEARSHAHYLRGSVLFPRGETEACLLAHQQALHHAKLGASRHAEARALSGLGDAYYIRGALTRAASHFDAGARLADQLGQVRLSRVNRVMTELIRVFCLDDPADALRKMLNHIEHAREELDLPGEAVGSSSAIYAAKLLYAAGPLEMMARQVLEVSRRSGRPRLGLAASAWVIEARVGQGREVDADRELHALYERCDGPELAFAALNILGSMLACHLGGQRRTWIYSEAGSILDSGRFASHCLYNFSRCALMDCLRENDHARLEHYAQRLETYTAPHQVAWGAFYCGWARSLSAWHRGKRSQDARSHLHSLKVRSAALGLLSETELLETALAL